jgi:hypothetical protein
MSMHADEELLERAGINSHGSNGNRGRKDEAVVIGLKVADEEEANTVFRVGVASIGLLGIAIVHNIMHRHHAGQDHHAFPHFVLAMMLPIMGLYGVHFRDTTAVYGFHLGNIIYIAGHGVLFVSMVLSLIALMEKDPIAECIHFDPTQDPKKPETFGVMTKICIEQVEHQQGHHRLLPFWWCIASIPMFGFSGFAAWHSLEFYMQLRIRGQSATVTGGSRATMFSSFSHSFSPLFGGEDAPCN